MTEDFLGLIGVRRIKTWRCMLESYDGRPTRRAYPKYVQCKAARDDVVLTRFVSDIWEIRRKIRHKYPKTIEVASKLECRIETEGKEAANVVRVTPEPPAYVEEM